MFHNGTRVKGTYEGIEFTGVIRELNGYSTVLLDRSISMNNDHKDRLYIDFDHNTGKSKTGNLVALPDRIDSELELLPLTVWSQDSADKEFKARLGTYADYRTAYVQLHTTYTTKKTAVTCEYGCKHMIDKRVPVLPTVDEIALKLAWSMHCISEYARYQTRLTELARREAYSSIIDRLVHGGSKVIHASGYFPGCYGDLPKATIKKIEDELKAHYERICAEYRQQILGKDIDS
jgi:hypothetical protein